MEQHLSIEGSHYSLLGLQRSGTAVYRGDHSYLRIGPPDRVQRDLSYHREMEKGRYPVARILSDGAHGEHAFFIEESLGTRSFRTIFAEEWARDGVISGASFDAYLAIVRTMFDAQVRGATRVLGEAAFAEAIRLSTLTNEMPDHAAQIEHMWHDVFERLSALPATISHGDLNPSNAYPNGIIDLEDSFIGPIGFDIVSAIMTQDWFPNDAAYEFPARFAFTDAQKKTFIATFNQLFNEASLPSFSHVFRDLSFCRAVWLCAGMNAWPKTQEWRFKKLLHEYLS